MANIKQFLFCIGFVILFSFYPIVPSIKAPNGYGIPNQALIACCGVATTIIVGKIAQTIYYDYFWSDKNMISYYHGAYRRIYNTLQNYHLLYTDKMSLNDTDLISIIKNSSSCHPFVVYHNQLEDALYAVENNISIIKDALKRITIKKEQIKTNTSTIRDESLEIFTQLEEQSTVLIAYSNKIHVMLLNLKDRIASFPEYRDDYHYWLYEKNHNQEPLTVNKRAKKRTTPTTHTITEDKQPEKEKPAETVHVPDAFDRTEKAIIEFNVNYY